jgi:hypothetical protein
MRTNVTFRSLSSALVGLAALFAALSNGCASPSSPEPAQVDFRGVYLSTSDGAIASIAFSKGERYLLQAKECRAVACAEAGFYRYDWARKELLLTSDASGTTRAIAVTVLATESAASRGALLGTRDLTTPETLLGSGEKLTEGDKTLNDGGEQKLNDKSSELLTKIVEALLDKQKMKGEGGEGEGAQGNGGGNGNANAGGDAPKAGYADCRATFPTPETAPADARAYWDRCPEGVNTPPKA